MKLRLLEGEALLYRGVVHLVKGYQHPEGYVIAYPRYSALLKRKLAGWEVYSAAQHMYWNCIKHVVPVTPLSEVVVFRKDTTDSTVDFVRSFLESALEVELFITGSAVATSEYRDVDLVAYGVSSDTVKRLEKLVNSGFLRRDFSTLVREYLEKHSVYMELPDYLLLKKDTVLHFVFQGVHVNVKLVELDRGCQGCIDPIYSYRLFNGVVEITKPVNPRVLPARYEALVSGLPVVLETLRELYAELKPGKYIVHNARLEERKSGTYLVPDLGVLKPLGQHTS